MICKEAVILAGGFGTRLQSVVSDIPKPMAPVGEKPFLFYILRYLESYGIQRTVLSVGYRHEVISGHFGSKFNKMELLYAVEAQPLGTGGAVKYAAQHLHSTQFFLLNGDSYFKSDLRALYKFHSEKDSKATLSLKKMHDFDRYGSVLMDNNGMISTFNEKQFCPEGLINAGIYLVEKQLIEIFPEEKFSFEKDILEKEVVNKTIYGQVFNEFFIDIGIPEDYARVQKNIEKLL